MENEFDDKIKVFEQEYFFDTEQERKFALRDFAKEISKEKDAEIKKLKEEIKTLKAGEIENHNDTDYSKGFWKDGCEKR